MKLTIHHIIKDFLHKLTNKRVVVGFSWWPDSVATYTLISDYYLSQHRDLNQIYIAHFNHWVRPESVHEAEYIRQNYKNVIIWNYQWASSREKELRDARHKFFQQALQQAETRVLILWHNLTDRLETMIMNIERWAGINGICNMQMIDKKKFLLLDTYTIIRPLLEYSKHHIIQFCDGCALRYFTDPSNNDSTVSKRNRIRTNLIKPLERWNKKPLLRRREQYHNKIVSMDSMDFDDLFRYGLGDRDSIARRYHTFSRPVYENTQQVFVKNIKLPRYFGFDFIYQIPQTIHIYDLIRILKWIGEYQDITQKYLHDLLQFVRTRESGYKTIWKRKREISHWRTYLYLSNSHFDAWHVLQFWLQYEQKESFIHRQHKRTHATKKRVIRLVDLRNDHYNWKTVNKRFINNKIPRFLRHIVPVYSNGNYGDSLIYDFVIQHVWQYVNF